VKNFAYTASQPNSPKNHGLQSNLAKTPAKKIRNKIDKVFRQEKRKQAREPCQKTRRCTKHNFAK
jgi:hypothetical protein